MCKASIVAKSVITAVVGEMYGIGINPLHNFGVVHPIGQAPEDCVACVKNGQRLTLSEIPTELQTHFGINDTATATFIDEGDNNHDMLLFDNGNEAVLCVFGGMGVNVYVGELDLTGIPNGHAVSEPVDMAPTDRELEPA